MSKQFSQREYWRDNLDPDNLGKRNRSENFDLREELDYYFSPEQEYALKKLWGSEGLRKKRILEIGSGMGVFALFLARQEADVYVVDIAPERLGFLRKQAKKYGLTDRIHIVTASAENLPFDSNYFDAVYTKSVLIHTQLEYASHEIHRVLRPGGRGVFVEPLTGNPFAGFYRKFFGPEEWKHITKYFDDQRMKILRRPFEKTSIRRFYFLSFCAFFWQFGWKNLSMFRLWVRALNGIDRILFQICPPLKNLAWFSVMCMEKQEEE